VSLKTQDILMCDYHGTFIFSWGGVVKTDQWSFSAIQIQKAILKLKITNAPASILNSSGVAIDYYDQKAMDWKELGYVKVVRHFTQEKGDAYREIDVTEVCKANPQFKWRMRVWTPFLIYYSCMGCKATLYLEYTAGEPEAQGTTSSTPFGNEALAPIAQMMDTMMNMMLMMMIMSMMISIIGTMTEIVGRS